MIKFSTIRSLVPIGCLFLLTSCFKEDVSNISDNIVMHQSYSVPLGMKEIVLDVPPVNDTSSTPGRYGSYYYNGKIYPLGSLYFEQSYEIPFYMHDKRDREEWITRLMFHILIINNFPTSVYSQVYIYSVNGVLMDSVFLDGPKLVEAAKINSQGEIIQPTEKMFDVPFEGDRLTSLKQALSLEYKGYIYSQDGIRLGDRNDVKINTAIQVDFEYNVNEL